MRQADIVGLTLAELALVLLFAFLAITVGSRSRLLKTVNELEGKNESAKAALGVAAKARDNLQRQNRVLVAELNRVSPHPRSSAPPSCVEIGAAKEWLFTATIKGRDSFEVDGRTLTMTDLLKKFDQEVSSARQAGCFHTAKVLLSPSISATDYDFALRQMEQHFYSKKLGIQR